MAQPPAPRHGGISIPRSSLIDPVEIMREVERYNAKILRGISAYENNTRMTHPLSNVVNTSAKRDAASKSKTSIPLIPVDKPGRFVCIIEIGNQKVKLMPDTGSYNTIIRRGYSPSSSPSSQPLNEVFHTSFGMEAHHLAVAGWQYTDNVIIGDLTVDRQMFGLVTTHAEGFLPFADGMIGMSLKPDLRNLVGPSLMQNLVNRELLINNMFAFNLDPNGPPALDIGGVNDRYQDNIAWVKVIETPYYWTAFVDEVRIGEHILRQRTLAMFDSGNILFHADPQTIEYLYKQVPGSHPGPGGFTFIPCTFGKSIFVTMAGKKFIIPPELFNLGSASIFGEPNLCLGAAFVSMIFPHPFLILGYRFMVVAYMVFDYGARRIGVANI